MKKLNNVITFTIKSLLLATTVLMTSETVVGAANDRPNILFIMSDDHCARAIGAYQGRLAPLNPTPTLDRLAAQGMRFDHVFCTNSICTPSRATILTGQFSHINGVRDLYDSLPGKKLYLPAEMKKAGYTTAVIGKWHLKKSPQFFDYYCVIAGQGRYMNPVMHTNGPGEIRKIRFDSTLTRKVNVVDTKGHSSDVLTNFTLEWLDKKRDKTKPFFLMHHFKAPHDMFVFAPRYKSYLEDKKIPEPTNLYDQPGPNFGSVATRGKDDSLLGVIGSTISPRKTKRNLTRHYRKRIQKAAGGKKLSDKELTYETHQRYVKEYLRCVKGIDDNLKRILDYLKDNNLMENTIIVYTSDQGMFLGEHDFIDKRWMYEESIRMPLIIRWPGVTKNGSSCDWLINNADFAPTLLEMAGAKPSQQMQGHSFASACKGEKEPDSWRKSTYYRYWMHMAHGHNNPAHFGIRTKKHKLIFFYGSDYKGTHNGRVVSNKGGNRFWKDTPAGWEFYDLEKDPHEMHNRYADPKYATTIADLKAELKHKRATLRDTDTDNPRLKRIIDKHWND